MGSFPHARPRHWLGHPLPKERAWKEAPWHFSISHTRQTVFCALSEKNIGIDAEELTRRVPEKLAIKTLSAMEFAQYAASVDKNRAFLTFWVLKEAAAKLSGRGIQYPPDQTEFSLSDSRVRELDGCLVAIITEDDHAL